VKSLTVTPKQFCSRKQPCKLRYYLLGQISFCVALNFTGNALCNPIPTEERLTAESYELERKMTEPQTSEEVNKFPVERSSMHPTSHQAKDLAPPPFSEESPELLSELSPEEILAAPKQVEDIGTTRKLTTRSFPLPPLPSSRCWRSTSSCTYIKSPNLVITIQPAEGRVDPEIGDLRISPIPEPQAELGELNIQPITVDPPTGAGDPELGTLRLQERTTPQPSLALPNRPRQPSAFLLARLDYFKTSNVFSDVDPRDDGLIRSGLTFFYAPPIGSRTFLITSIDANLVRYANLNTSSYDELRFRAGIFHRITPRVSGEIGWSNQKLVTADRGFREIFDGRRFFQDNSIRLELSRQDQLSPKLSLNTYYQFRWSIAEPIDFRGSREDRSRILNSLIATLSYNFNPQLQTAIDYQFTWSHFTQQERDDFYHQLVARLTYRASARTQVNVFSGFSFGNSSDRRINFDSFIFGAGLVFNLPLF
jgi:hypothetical protein